MFDDRCNMILHPEVCQCIVQFQNNCNRLREIIVLWKIYGKKSSKTRRKGSIILGYMKFLCIFLWNKIIAVKFEIKHKILLKWKEFIDDESTLNILFIYRWTQLYQSQRKFTKEKMLLMKTKSTFLELHH